MKVFICQINPTIGDLSGNTSKIINGIQQAKESKANLVIFPELSLCGYPPEDLLLLSNFLQKIEEYLKKIISFTDGITAILGLPRKNPTSQEKKLYNSAAVIENGVLLGFQDKILLPNYDVFDEARYFEPGKGCKLWEIAGQRVAITICEDIWQHSELLKFTSYRHDPIEEYKKLGPDLLINLSASPFNIHKQHQRLEACSKAAKTLQCPLILCNQVGGNDSLIFDGKSLLVGKDGLLREAFASFKEDEKCVDSDKSTHVVMTKSDEIGDLYHALVLGLRDYVQKTGFQHACLGLSGGIDSALVACLAVEALGYKNVFALGMPSRFSSEESIVDARQLAENLGINYTVVPIEKPFESYLKLLEPNFDSKPFDVTEENLQARIRGMILMAFSNKFGYLVLSTGNKSEMAMGYATLYGDMCGGLGVINDVTKRQVYALSRWINRDKEIIPNRTISKPPSAELRLNQKDSDSLPDYEIVDNVLQEYLENHSSPENIAKKFHYSLELVDTLIKKIHRNEYKRRQSPPGLKISEKAFSVGRRFPIVQRFVK